MAAPGEGKVILGKFADVPGSGAGQTQAPQGIAVNRTGAGAAEAGDVYLADTGNNRVDVFSATGTFKFAFGMEVDQTSGGDLCTAASGDACKAGVSSAAGGSIAAPQGMAIDQDTGTIYVTSGSNNRVEVFSAGGEYVASFGRGVVMSGPGSLPPDTFNERQTVETRANFGTVSGGTFTLAFAGQTSGPIPWDASAAAVQTSLETLSSVGSGNVGVTKPRQGLWEVEFVGTLAGTDVAQMTGSGAGLTGSGVFIKPSVLVTTSVPGGPQEPYEVCRPLTGDVCEAGLASSAAGGLRLNSLEPSHPAIGPEGDLYVPDPGNVRIDQFHPVLNGSGEVTDVTVVRAIGWKVAVSGAAEGIQACTAAGGCQQGTAGTADGQLSAKSPSSLAVAGDGSIYAVRATGSCSAANPCKVVKINADASASEDFSPENVTTTNGGAPLAVAVDPASQDLFVAKKSTTTEYRLLELSPTGLLLATSPAAGGLVSPGSARYGLAVGTEGRLYLSTQPVGTGGQVYLLGPAPPPSVAFGDVTDTGPREATFTGTVTPPAEIEGSTFETRWRFEYSTDQSEWTRVPVPDGDAGSDPGVPVPVDATAKGLEPSKRYFVRLCAVTGPTVCAPEPVAQFTTLGSSPEILETYGADITQISATLGARVNPENSATTYYFEWGPTSAYGHRTPAFDRPIGSGGTSITAAEEIGGLQANSTYHYRIIATNATGPTIGPDHHFTTLNSAGFPNDRGLELVSPMPIGPQGLVNRLFAHQLAWQAAADGGSVVFPVLNGTEDTTKGGEVRYRAARTPGAWHSEQLSPPSLVQRGEDGGATAETSNIHWASDELSCSLLESVNPLTPDVPAVDREVGVTNLYSRDDAGGYTLISNTIPANPTLKAHEVGENPYFIVGGSSQDCSRVYFQSRYELLPGASGLYEWHDGILRDAGVLPDGTAVPGGAESVGIGGVIVHGPTATAGTRANAVSEDASRFFFTAISNAAPDQGKQAVFMHEGATSVDVSQPTGSGGTLGAHYETASPDGSRVFFTANYGLSSTSSIGPTTGACSTGRPTNTACDLYEYDVERHELVDLSADSNAADSKGAVVEGVVAVSKDGNVVYFAALGQLVPGQGNTYVQNLEGEGSANLYMARGPERTLTYVATISREDLGRSAGVGGTSADDGTHGLLMKKPGRWNAQTTPDGQQLLFVSERPLSGYQSGGPVEAFLYSAPEESLVCISCRRDGRPSVASTESTPILGTPASEESQLYFPRAISTDGSRVFFTIADPLAPGAVSGAKNLYLWEDGSVYLLNTETKGIPSSREFNTNNVFYDASASGDDVFFVSLNRLAPQDKDNVQSLYDLRVGGGFAPEPEPPAPCNPLLEGACQAAVLPTPSPSAAVTPNFHGPGNQPPSSKRHKKKNHKKHRRDHHRRHQHSKHKGKAKHRKHKQSDSRRASHRASRYGGGK